MVDKPVDRWSIAKLLGVFTKIAHGILTTNSPEKAVGHLLLPLSERVEMISERFIPASYVW